MNSEAYHRVPDTAETWKVEGGQLIMKPRGLSINWGNHTDHWRIPQPNEDGPAELLNVTWLEVGAIKDIDPKKSYQIGFRVSLSKTWMDDLPIYIMAKRGEGGNHIARKVILGGNRPLNQEFNIPDNFVVKFARGDSSEPKLHISLFECWDMHHCKSGLLIHHAFVKEVN
ncbi:hypothetical protein LguiA_007386 [Lonicera macranthoides]